MTKEFKTEAEAKMDEVKHFTLTLDGHSVQAEKGTTILELANQLNIPIPTLCHVELVRPHMSCRVCLVEVVKGDKSILVPSCTYPAREGIEVKTNTPKVREERQKILERLLTKCPDVPIIRQMAEEYGAEESEGDNVYKNCIACGLCARVCNDVVQAGAISWIRSKDRTADGAPFELHPDKCIGCGACAQVCPTDHIRVEPFWALNGEPREFTLGPETAVYVPTYQAVPKVPVIDEDACIHFKTGGCKVCEQVCETGAIDHDMKEQTEEIEVGQILIATGYDLFDAKKLRQYGYGQLDNVYTSLDIEYMLNASGPTGGTIRLKNGREPKSVGIIHCVGSRDVHNHAYCSRVCCMYALKFAHLIKERTSAEVYQFYIDMRSFGKGYEEFYSRILDEDVNVVRGKVAEVVSNGVSNNGNRNLLLRCEDTLIKRFREIPVDMVILCSALEPEHDTDKIKRLFSLSLSQDGFFLEKHPKLDPTATTTDGIYIAGCCQGPKDIPDTVAQASSAAARILSHINKGEVEIEPFQARIDPKVCAGCKLCYNLCPYGAITFDDKENVSKVNEMLCKGCGTCVSACPSSAITAKGYSDAQVFAEIEGILHEGV
jgi:heterodisulfide reductase subunit A